MKYTQKVSLKGFTLIEVLVSLFIFAIIMIATSQIFASAFQGYRYTRTVQKDAENAQFALNILAKELRTSTVVSPTAGPFPQRSTSVQFYDHSQQTCFLYRILGGALEMASRTAVPDVASCASASLVTFRTISTGTVIGNFLVTPSSIAPARVGRVTISLDVNEGSTHRVRIQTSVSLRDYGNSIF